MTEAIPQSIANPVPLPANEVERLEALRRYKVLDTPPEAAFDRITSLAARLFHVPTVLVSLVDESRAWFKSCYGFEQPEVPRDATLCSIALLSDEVLVVPDARQDDRFACNSFVQSEPGVRFYAGAPLLTENGFNLGTLCLLDTKPRDALTDEQKVVLADLAAIVVDELELRLAVAMQIAAEQERQQADEMRREAAQRLQLYADVVGNAQVGIVVWQLEDLNNPDSFRLLIANSAASEATGLNFEPMVGKTMVEIFPTLLQSPLVQQYREVATMGRSLDLGEVSYGEDGITAGIYSIKAFSLPDQCCGLAFENVTAQKHIEAQLQASQYYNQQIAEALPGILFVYDLIQQQIVYTNRQITDLLGYTSEQVQAMGANALAILIHPDDLDRVFAYFETFRSTPDDVAVLGIEYRVHHVNGEWRWMYSQSVLFNHTADGLPHQLLGVSLDMTERQKIEQALRESEEWARLAIQVAQVGGWRLHLDTNLVELDERMCQIWGEPADAMMIPLPCVLERIHSDDRQRVANAVNVALDPQSLGTYETEYRIVWDDGTERWVLAKGQVQFDRESKQAVDFFGTSLDITHRKQAEAVVQESEERLRLALTAANQGLYDLNVQTGDAVVSPEYALMLGYEPSEFQETNVQWRDRLHPDDVAIVYQTYEDYISGKHHEYRVEFRQRTKSGDWKWILSVGSIVSWDNHGQPMRMLGTHTDITERKQGEQALQEHSERLNLLYQTTRELLSAENPLDLMNHLFAKLSVQMDLQYYYHFQVREQEGRQRLRLMNYSGISEEQAQAFELIDLDQAMCGLVAKERRQIVLGQAEIATHPNAQTICAMGVTAYAGQPLMVQGRLLGTLSFASFTRTQFSAEETYLLQAISEQVAIALDRSELVASLQQQTDDLAKANRVKDEFLAVLSHELRSPLNPILGWTKLLQTGKFDPQKTKQALGIIERNVKQQTQLIDDLLDISRILRGKLTLSEAAVNLAFTIESALETMRLAAEAKSIQIKTKLDSSLPPVLGDAGRLQQIVVNLLSNAIKFTPNGGQVEVRLEQVRTEAQIQVKDTGKGITPDFLPYVFESFRQEDSRTTRKFGGLGLGLAIVRQLTELHGGTVRAESSGEGAGATFTICLPLMKIQSLWADSNQTPIASNGVNALQGIRILVVDDEADMRDLVATILEQVGAIVQIAASASEALAIFDQFQPMLLVSDIGMPETDGYELMQQVKSRLSHTGKQIPAIALTAYAMEQDQQQALAAGFQRHVAKPIEPEVLVKEIVALINRK